MVEKTKREVMLEVSEAPRPARPANILVRFPKKNRKPSSEIL